MAKIAVYIGSVADGTNQIFGKQPWEKFFGSHEVEVFGSSSLPAQARNQYNEYRTTPRRSNNPFVKIINGYYDCSEYLAEHSPDILVQLMRTPTHTPSVVRAGQSENIPVVTRVTGDLFQQYKTSNGTWSKLGGYILNNIVDKYYIKQSASVIVLGPYQKSQLRKQGMKEEDIYILPPILRDNSPFKPTKNQAAIREAIQLPKKKTVIFYAGRLNYPKGMEFLLDVVDATIHDDDLLYVLAGEGNYQSKFNKKYDQESVRTVGQIDYNQIHRYYQAADLYLHPSPREGIPLSIVEALNCETPVVARDAGDISFITPNFVHTPEEMAGVILNREYDADWCNKDIFTVDVIRGRMQELINSILM